MAPTTAEATQVAPAPLTALRHDQPPLEPAPFAVSRAPPAADILRASRAQLPPGADIPATIRIHLPNGSSQARFTTMAAVVQAAGFDDVRSARTPYSIRETQVRYFHPEDAAAAAIVADRTGAQIRDFTDYRPSPPPGSIEVWVAGRAAGGAASRGGGAFSLTQEVETFRAAVSDLLTSFPGANER
jgi:hypothetical protein